MGRAETQSKIGDTSDLTQLHTDLQNLETDIHSTNSKIDALEVKLDDFKKALSSIGTDSWQVQSV